MEACESSDIKVSAEARSTVALDHEAVNGREDSQGCSSSSPNLDESEAEENSSQSTNEHDSTSQALEHNNNSQDGVKFIKEASPAQLEKTEPEQLKERSSSAERCGPEAGNLPAKIDIHASSERDQQDSCVKVEHKSITEQLNIEKMPPSGFNPVVFKETSNEPIDLATHAKHELDSRQHTPNGTDYSLTQALDLTSCNEAQVSCSTTAAEPQSRDLPSLSSTLNGTESPSPDAENGDLSSCDLDNEGAEQLFIPKSSPAQSDAEKQEHEHEQSTPVNCIKSKTSTEELPPKFIKVNGDHNVLQVVDESHAHQLKETMHLHHERPQLTSKTITGADPPKISLEAKSDTTNEFIEKPRIVPQTSPLQNEQDALESAATYSVIKEPATTMDNSDNCSVASEASSCDQLVIDHPKEEALSRFEMPEQLPVKLCLKRKFSTTAEHGTLESGIWTSQTTQPTPAKRVRANSIAATVHTPTEKSAANLAEKQQVYTPLTPARDSPLLNSLLTMPRAIKQDDAKVAASPNNKTMEKTINKRKRLLDLQLGVRNIETTLMSDFLTKQDVDVAPSVGHLKAAIHVGNSCAEKTNSPASLSRTEITSQLIQPPSVTRIDAAAQHEPAHITRIEPAPQLTQPSPSNKRAGFPKSTQPREKVRVTPMQAISLTGVQLKAKWYQCQICHRYYKTSAFFMHIKQMHNAYSCLHCLKIFKTQERLAMHLEIKHDLEQHHFNNEEALLRTAAVDTLDSLSMQMPKIKCPVCAIFLKMAEYVQHLRERHKINYEIENEPRTLICCNCDRAFLENENYGDHICELPKKGCNVCGELNRHSNECTKTKKKDKSKTPNAKPVLKTIKGTPAVVTTTIQPQTNTNICDRTASPPRSLTPTVVAPTPTLPHAENSNDSCNMVIDETCSNSLNYNDSMPVNPFKLLDEQEKLLEQIPAQMQPELPPDRVPEPFPEQSHELPAAPEDPPLLVPKVVFRVPKEFQKSVDASFSSTDSENDEEPNDEANNDPDTNVGSVDENKDDAMDVTIEQPETTQNAVLGVKEQNENEEEEAEDDDENTLSQSMSLIQEAIERTQREIQLTKGCMRRPSERSASRASATGPISTPIPQKMELIETAQDNENKETDIAEQNLQESSTLDMSISSPVDNGIPTLNEDQNIREKLAQDTQDAPVTYREENDSDVNIDNSAEVGETDRSFNDVEMAVIKPADEVAPLQPAPPSDGIQIAGEEVLVSPLVLTQHPIKLHMVEFVRICIAEAYNLCLYCNHARRIAVDAKRLVLHLLSHHSFSAKIYEDQEVCESLEPPEIVQILKSYLPGLEEQYLNLQSYSSLEKDIYSGEYNERIFECFSCRFVTSTHKELYLHNRKHHPKTALPCFMCRSKFDSYSEILCHMCPGQGNATSSVFDIKYRCCLCKLDKINSAFRLMVHLRHTHSSCDVCLENCVDQIKLSSHVWKHKLHHFCFSCGILYRNKNDINKHLFWKHGTESSVCKRCTGKRWPHVYHFCIPPPLFVCNVCNQSFTKAVRLRVHTRLHKDEFPYACTKEGCEQKFISRRILAKHENEHVPIVNASNEDAIAADDKEADISDLNKKEEEQVSDKVENSETTLEEQSEAISEQKEIVEEPKENTSTEQVSESTTKPSAESGDNMPGKKKKKKRRKDSFKLTDLGLRALNLSESDSDSDTGSECSVVASATLKLPTPRLSPCPAVEAPKPEIEVTATEISIPIEPEFWQELLKAQGSAAAHTAVDAPKSICSDDDDDNSCAMPTKLHVAVSDHDYCKFLALDSPKKKRKQEISKAEEENIERHSEASKQEPAATKKNSDSDSEDDSSSSSSSSSGSDDSSNSDSSSSSSSSSSDSDSDSDASDEEKEKHESSKTEKQKRSESKSPLKKDVKTHDPEEEEINVGLEDLPKAAAVAQEPLFHESDFDSFESESDEDFYDENPMKLVHDAKRATLLAQGVSDGLGTKPILTGTTELLDMGNDHKSRSNKKKKRGQQRYNEEPASFSNTIGAQMLPNALNHFPQTPTQPLRRQSLTYGIASQFGSSNFAGMRQEGAGVPAYINHLQARPSDPQRYTHRMSEGDSCSDADGSRQRSSKRERRPNRFYGYTSDDENFSSHTVIMGIKAMKPQPPPVLTWSKEDLPSPPKKSALKKRSKALRTPKASQNGMHAGTDFSVPTKRSRKRMEGESNRRRRTNKKNGKSKSELPPIPTLKIRASEIGLTPILQNSTMPPGHFTIQHNSSLGIAPEPERRIVEEEDGNGSDSSSSSSDEPNEEMIHQLGGTMKPLHATRQPTAADNAAMLQRSLLIPQLLQKPPTPPPAKVFNRQIPPALLPNPDLATLQYFKANNIRYPIRPPAGARPARDGEAVYCYCRCPYDEVSEMIACDGSSCLIEWFHFECVGIMVAPSGRWYCPECRPKHMNELYNNTMPAIEGGGGVGPGIMPA